MSGLNMYDVREKCNPDLPLCYNFTLVDAFLEQEEVVEALNVKKGRGWKDCNHLVNLKMVLAGDWMISLKEDVKTLLHAGIPVVVYNGEYDFICNWMGSQAWTQQLQWDGADEFAKAENTTWTVNGEFAGTAVSAQGLTFLRVKDAGHMVPLDQPENALDMIMRVVNNLPFRGD